CSAPGAPSTEPASADQAARQPHTPTAAISATAITPAHQPKLSAKARNRRPTTPRTRHDPARRTPDNRHTSAATMINSTTAANRTRLAYLRTSHAGPSPSPPETSDGRRLAGAQVDVNHLAYPGDLRPRDCR